MRSMIKSRAFPAFRSTGCDRWATRRRARHSRRSRLPFTRKLTDRMGTLGNGWEDVQSFCLAAEGEAIGDSQLASVWEPAELRSDTEFWTNAQLKIAAGVPEEQIWEEGGYTAEQIAKFKAQAEADKAAEQEQMASMLGQRIVRSRIRV
jgi:hypothetical protein